MYATVESLRWGDVTDWPRVTVERALDGFALRTNATDVAADISFGVSESGHAAVHQIRIRPEHREGPFLRVLLALVAAKSRTVVRVDPAPANVFHRELKALGFTPEYP